MGNRLSFKNVLSSASLSISFSLKHFSVNDSIFCIDYRDDMDVMITEYMKTSDAKMLKVKETPITASSLSLLYTKIAHTLNTLDRSKCYFVVNPEDQMQMFRYTELYNSVNFNSKKKLRYILKSELKSLTKGTATQQELEQHKVIMKRGEEKTYGVHREISYQERTIPKDKPYLSKILGINKECRISNLDLFSYGNMYIFLDCEFDAGEESVREISAIIAIMKECQLEPVATLMCKEATAVATCAKFSLMFPKFIEEYKQQYNVGVAYFVGNQIGNDITKIYKTLGTSVLGNYNEINTGEMDWQSTWLNIMLDKRLPLTTSLESLFERTYLGKSTIEDITKQIYGLDNTKIHTSMYDTTLLFVLLNLLLLQRYDYDAYREMHFSLVKTE